jgi:hypothetical protein
MTGYESKRAAARDKLDDDRRAYYEKFDDLYAVYLNGVYDGKKAAQPAQEPINVRAKFLAENIVESIDCGDAAGAKTTLEMLTALAQPAQEPVVCCQQYDTCLQPCTPRGEYLAQRPWVGLMRGVRVEGDTVVIKVQSNNEARLLCSELVNEMGKNT